MLNWSLLLDVVMIGLLGGTISYAYVLNKNLNKLRSEKAAFEFSIQHLTQSIRQAETGLHDLKLSAQEIGGQLEHHISVGRGLSQELQFMIQSADSLANRLSNAAESGGARAAAMPPMPEPPKTKPDAKPKSQAEARLLEELKRLETVKSKTAGGAG